MALRVAASGAGKTCGRFTLWTSGVDNRSRRRDECSFSAEKRMQPTYVHRVAVPSVRSCDLIGTGMGTSSRRLDCAHEA